ncbi:MAG: hypothetical protein LC650_01275 [Actinobacteria bacterium]|nr:hypothetical protein [Actinomycetota bacterium]
MTGQGRITEVSEGGKKLVRPEDVLNILAQNRKAGRPSTQDQLEEYNIKKGTVVTWVVEVQKQVAVVDGETDHLTQMKGMLNRRDPKVPKDIIMRKIALSDHIKAGTMTTDDCDKILDAIVLSWRLNDRLELADRLQEFIDKEIN